VSVCALQERNAGMRMEELQARMRRLHPADGGEA
jgi:hypothetical protein